MQHPTPPFTPQEYLALENTSATHRMPRDIASAATRGLSIQFRAATSTPSDLRPGSLRLFSARAQCCSVPGKALDELQLTHQQSRTEFIARDEALRLQIQRSCSAVTVNVIGKVPQLRPRYVARTLLSAGFAFVASSKHPISCAGRTLFHHRNDRPQADAKHRHPAVQPFFVAKINGRARVQVVSSTPTT
jgi:hypothetical protein